MTRNRKAGLTMVEVALLLCIAGIVLAVTVPTFFRNVRTSKLDEVTVQLNALYRATAAYYRSSHPSPGGARENRCLPSKAGPTPEKPSPEPVEVDFTEPAAAGSDSWRALGFNPSAPLRFRYTFVPLRDGCAQAPSADGPPALVLRAEGDLDGDGEYSTFERSFVVNEKGGLVPAELLMVRDRTE